MPPKRQESDGSKPFKPLGPVAAGSSSGARSSTRDAADKATDRISGKLDDLDASGRPQIQSGSKSAVVLLTENQVKLASLDAGQLPGDTGKGYIHEFNSLVKDVDQTGPQPLIEAAMKAEIESGSPFGKDLSEFSNLYILGAYISICSLPRGVLKEICGGNISKAIAQGRGLPIRAEMKKNTKRSKQKHPQIYIRHLSSGKDGEWDHMTADKVLCVLDELELYIAATPRKSDADTCFQYDTAFDTDGESVWTRELSEHGFRRWLSNTHEMNEWKPVTSRYRQGRAFISSMKKRIRDMKANHSGGGPLYVPLQYVGYALDSYVRDKQHKQHSKHGNWLSNIFLAIAITLWPADEWEFCHWSICPLALEYQAAIAEMVITRITNSYYHMGGGFNIELAGKSMASIKMLSKSGLDRTQVWADHQTWLLQKFDLDNKMKEQLQAMSAWQQSMDDEEEARLVAQIQQKDNAFAALREQTEDVLERVRAVEGSQHVRVKHPTAPDMAYKAHKALEDLATRYQ